MIRTSGSAASSASTSPAHSAPGMPSISWRSASSRPPRRKSSSHRMTRAPARAGRERRHQAGRPAADHQHVAMRECLLVMVRDPPRRGAAEARGAADQRLVELLPELRRPHEGLVVEAGDEEAREPVVHRADVEAQRRPAVLARGDQPVVELGRGRARVRLAPRAGAQFDQRVRLFRACREDAARAVILERAADQLHAVGEQRRGERVARRSPNTLARRT